MNMVHIQVPEQDYFSREAYKSLRTNVQFCGADKKVIDITSCQPNEGKSTTSLQLAVSLAQLGKRTVLVDADLRKSVLIGTTKPNRKNILGLTHALVGQNTLEDVLNETDIPNFYVIYAGPVPPNPSELLGGEIFSNMIRVLRENFDYVIIDSPPLGSVIDSAVIMEKADGVILTIQANAISYRFAQDIKDQIVKTGCPLLGVILNKVDMQGDRYGRYGKYGKYGKYGRYGKYGKYGGYYKNESDGEDA